MIVAQDATTLVVSTQGSQGQERLSFKLDGSEKSNRYGPYTMKQTWSLKDQTLVVEAVLISKTTGAPIVEPGKTTFRRN
jgi:hypothetical protein